MASCCLSSTAAPLRLALMLLATSSAHALRATPPSARALARMVFPSDLPLPPKANGPPPPDIADMMAEVVKEESATASLESSLLQACASCFTNGLSFPSPDTCAEVAQRALALERAAKEARSNAILTAGEARAGLLGDWRLVFTNSEQTVQAGVTGFGAAPLCSTKAVFQRFTPGQANGFDAGVRGPGVGRLQCVELLGLPLGVQNAVALKGSWKVDEDEEGSILVSSYEQVEAAGGAQMPSMPNIGQTVLTAVEHVGYRVRVERAANNALFVWERQERSIDEQINEMIS